jgi:FlaG/FlaF family flagellin (archaellin)
MKNAYKLFGIIVLAAVIGFSLLGCEEPEQEAKISVVNQSSGTIIDRLKVTGYIETAVFLDKKDLNITSGGSKTFTIDAYTGDNDRVFLYDDKDVKIIEIQNRVFFEAGFTTVITFNGSGVDVKNP